MVVFLGVSLRLPAAEPVRVTNDAELRTALRGAQPGTVIRLAPGRYQPGVFVANLRGTAEEPIVIEGADPDNRPLFEGGTTGWAWDIHVEGCVFVGSQTPIAFVGVDGAVVRYNTIYQPGKWVMRILQETTEPGFAPCRYGRFERNLIVFRRADVGVPVNIGPHTRPDTFMFADNLWYCADRPQASRPDLPTTETGGLYGIDPGLTSLEEGRLRPRNPQAAAFGASAWPGPAVQGMDE